MQEIKTFISIIAVALTVSGYIPYIRDTIRGKTTPHVFTWLIWVLVTAIAWGLQVVGGAGVGSWVTLAVVIMASFILIVGFRNGKKDITQSDVVFLILSFIALFLWLIIKQPVLSVILVSLIDLLAFGPTIRKTWNKPYSETLSSYQMNALRHGLSLFALQEYNIITWLYPATWVLANALFSIMMMVRRKQIDK